jgi:hypothetical protein
MLSPNTSFRTEPNPHFRPWIFIAVGMWVLVAILAACDGQPPPLESRADRPVLTDAAAPPGECRYIGPDTISCDYVEGCG